MRATRTIIVASIVCALSITSAHADTFELRASGVYYAPSGAATTGGEQSDVPEVEWDKGTGFELQGILWPDESSWGFGASIGTATWDINHVEESYYDYDYDSAYANIFDGDADLTSLGVSVFRKLSTQNDKLRIVAEGGVRFISIDTDIDGGWGVAGRHGTRGYSQTLEIDDSVAGVLALDLDYSVDERISFFAQAGFLFDISKGEVQNVVDGIGTFDAGETELQALFGKVGIAISL
jgi:hypothetical protein